MLPYKSQSNEKDNVLQTHFTKRLLAGFCIENNDGIQEIWNNSLIYRSVIQPK